MRDSDKFKEMDRGQLNELAREWSGKDTIWGNNEKIEEVSDESLRKWLSANQPCPAIKRNGDVCAGLPVSASQATASPTTLSLPTRALRADAQRARRPGRRRS